MESNSPMGFDAVTIEVSSSAVARFHQLFQWETAKIPAKLRPSFESWLESRVNLHHSKNDEKYAENQANAKLEKLVFQLAIRDNITPHEAAQKYGVQLLEKK